MIVAWVSEEFHSFIIQEYDMPLNSAELSKIASATINAFGKNKPVDQINVSRPLLDILLPKAGDIIGGTNGFTMNIFKSNGANGQLFSGNANVSYNSRTPNEIATYNWMNHHDGFVLNEDELMRNGIQVNDDVGRSTATVGETVQLSSMIESNFMALEEGVKDHIHRLLWSANSGVIDAVPGIDAIVSTTPTVGTVGGIDAAANAYWRNFARTGLGVTLVALMDALEQSKRDIQRIKGRFTHIFAGAAFYDALRNAVIGANVTQVTYGSGSKLQIDMATDVLKFDGIPITYVPDFDTGFGDSPAIPWTKRLYMLNLSNQDGIILKRAKSDFMKMRFPGRAIDQYAYHYGMTSKFGLGCFKRATNAVCAIA